MYYIIWIVQEYLKFIQSPNKSPQYIMLSAGIYYFSLS